MNVEVVWLCACAYDVCPFNQSVRSVASIMPSFHSISNRFCHHGFSFVLIENFIRIIDFAMQSKSNEILVQMNAIYASK